MNTHIQNYQKKGGGKTIFIKAITYMGKKTHNHKIKIENKEIISGKRKSKAFKVITGHRLVSDEAKFKLHVPGPERKAEPPLLSVWMPTSH